MWAFTQIRVSRTTQTMMWSKVWRESVGATHPVHGDGTAMSVYLHQLIESFNDPPICKMIIYPYKFTTCQLVNSGSCSHTDDTWQGSDSDGILWLLMVGRWYPLFQFTTMALCLIQIASFTVFLHQFCSLAKTLVLSMHTCVLNPDNNTMFLWISI